MGNQGSLRKGDIVKFSLSSPSRVISSFFSPPFFYLSLEDGWSDEIVSQALTWKLQDTSAYWQSWQFPGFFRVPRCQGTQTSYLQFSRWFTLPCLLPKPSLLPRHPMIPPVYLIRSVSPSSKSLGTPRGAFTLPLTDSGNAGMHKAASPCLPQQLLPQLTLALRISQEIDLTASTQSWFYTPLHFELKTLLRNKIGCHELPKLILCHFSYNMWKATNLSTHVGSDGKALRLYHLQSKGRSSFIRLYPFLFIVSLSDWRVPLQLPCLSLPWWRMNESMNDSLESPVLLWAGFYITDISSTPIGCGLHKVRDFCGFYSLNSLCNIEDLFQWIFVDRIKWKAGTPWAERNDWNTMLIFM